MINYQLGRAVIDRVNSTPDNFDMGGWCSVPPEAEDTDYVITASNFTECGTTACLGGWTMLLSGYRYAAATGFLRPDGSLVTRRYADEAMRLLGMTEAESFGGYIHEIWFDGTNGLQRFTELVEHSEQAAQS